VFVGFGAGLEVDEDGLLQVLVDGVGLTEDGPSSSTRITIGADWDQNANGAQNILIGGGYGEFLNEINSTVGLGFIFAGYNNDHSGGIASGFVGHHHGTMYPGADHAFSAGGSYHVLGDASSPSTPVSYPVAIGGTALTVKGSRSAAVGGQTVVVSGQSAGAFASDNSTVSGNHAFSGAALRSLAQGVGSQVFGADNEALEDYGQATGRYAKSRLQGAQALGHGRFAVSGDSQSYILPLRGQTTNATATRLGLLGSGSTALTVPEGTVMSIRAHIVGVEASTGDMASYMVVAAIKNVAGTVALVGTSTTTVNGEDESAWNAYAEADDANNYLALRVVGEAGKTIRWTCRAEIVESMMAA
jgi:hypothetical protein